MLILFLYTGILQCDVGNVRDNKQVFRLFCHETLRVFHDRLINNEDKQYFHAMLAEMASKYFSEVSQTTLKIIGQVISLATR